MGVNFGEVNLIDHPAALDQARTALAEGASICLIMGQTDVHTFRPVPHLFTPEESAQIYALVESILLAR